MLKAGHDLLGPAAERHRWIVWVEGQAHVGFLGLRHDRFQEALSPLELLGAGVGANPLTGREVLRQFIVIRRVAAPARPISSL